MPEQRCHSHVFVPWSQSLHCIVTVVFCPIPVLSCDPADTLNHPPRVRGMFGQSSLCWRWCASQQVAQSIRLTQTRIFASHQRPPDNVKESRLIAELAQHDDGDEESVAWPCPRRRGQQHIEDKHKMRRIHSVLQNPSRIDAIVTLLLADAAPK